MEQKRFEVGKTYTEADTNKIGIEIKVLSRTEKTITFIYTKKNWWKQEIDLENATIDVNKSLYKRKPDFCFG